MENKPCPKSNTRSSNQGFPIFTTSAPEHASICPEHTRSPNYYIETSTAKFFPCDFAEAGCQALICQRDYSHHMMENLSHHHLLVSQLNLKITKEIQSKLDFEKESSLRQKLRQLQMELAEKDAECVRLQVEVKMLRKQIKGNEVVGYGGHIGNPAAGTFDWNYDKLEDDIVKPIENASVHKTLPLRDEEFNVPKNLKDPVKSSMSVPHQSNFWRLGTSNVNTNSDLMLFDKPERNPGNDPPSYTAREEKKYDERSEVLAPCQREVLAPCQREVLAPCQYENGALQHERNTATSQDSIVPRVFAPSGNATLEGKKYGFFKGVQESVLITGLNQAWGLAIAGNFIFVVDANRKSGVVRRVSLDGSTNVVVPGINLQMPRGLALDKNMNIIVVDSGAHQIFKFTSEGTLLAASGECGSGDGEFKGPIGVTVDATGRIFVCDRLNHRIQVLDENLVFTNMFGEMGTGILQFTYPWDVAFDSQGNIYIADCGNHCVKVLTPYMTHLRLIGIGNFPYNNRNLKAPTSVFLDSFDNLYVTDRGLSCVLVYDSKGLYIMSFGNFVEPNAVCTDGSGRVYVSENGKGKFNGSGRVIVYT